MFRIHKPSGSQRKSRQDFACGRSRCVAIAAYLVTMGLFCRVSQGEVEPTPAGEAASNRGDPEVVARLEDDDVSANRSLQSLEEQLLFQPVKHPSGLDWDAAHSGGADVFFRSKDGTRLHGWYCPVSKPRGSVLYLHGSTGNVTHCRDHLTLWKKLGLSVMTFDYRGYGQSEGGPTVDGVVADAFAARTYLARTDGISEKAVILHGRDLGGAIAAQLAAEESPRAMILESTYSSYRDLAHFHVPGESTLVPKHQLNSVEALHCYEGPLLQAHGNADTVVPYILGKRLFDEAHTSKEQPKEFIVLRGRNHSDPLPANFEGVVDNFLKHLISTQR